MLCIFLSESSLATSTDFSLTMNQLQGNLDCFCVDAKCSHFFPSKSSKWHTKNNFGFFSPFCCNHQKQNQEQTFHTQKGNFATTSTAWSVWNWNIKMSFCQIKTIHESKPIRLSTQIQVAQAKKITAVLFICLLLSLQVQSKGSNTINLAYRGNWKANPAASYAAGSRVGCLFLRQGLGWPSAMCHISLACCKSWIRNCWLAVWYWEWRKT